MTIIKTQLGQSLLDRPFQPTAVTGQCYQAVFSDQDLHEHYSETFAPTSGSEFLIWSVECQTIGRQLGHHELAIYRVLATGRAPLRPTDRVVSWSRSKNGDWLPDGILYEIQELDDQNDTSAS